MLIVRAAGRNEASGSRVLGRERRLAVRHLLLLRWKWLALARRRDAAGRRGETAQRKWLRLPLASGRRRPEQRRDSESGVQLRHVLDADAALASPEHLSDAQELAA